MKDYRPEEIEEIFDAENLRRLAESSAELLADGDPEMGKNMILAALMQTDKQKASKTQHEQIQQLIDKSILYVQDHESRLELESAAEKSNGSSVSSTSLRRSLDRFLELIYFKFGLLEPVDYESDRLNRDKWSLPGIWRLAFALIIVLVATIILQQKNAKQEQVITSEMNRSDGILLSANKESKLIHYARDVMLSMNVGTRVNKVSDGLLSIDQGNIWLDVEKGGKGFEVQTAFGQVVVTGTSFGVYTLGNEIVVEVSEGRVKLESEKDIRYINAGEKRIMSALGFSDTLPREEGLVKPVWAGNLERDVWLAKIPSLVAHWDMESDPGSDQILDSSTSQIHGTFDSSISSSKPEFGFPSVRTNIFGSALKMNHSVRQNIDMKNTQAITELTKDFTIMAWIKRDDFKGYQRIFSCVGNGWKYGFVDNSILFDIYPGGGNATVYQTELTARHLKSEWMHVACVVSRSTNQILHLVDGELIKPHDIKSPIHQGEGKWRLGAGVHITPKGSEIPKSSTFGGLIDEVRIYSEALDVETIRKISKIDLIKGRIQNEQVKSK